MSCRSACFCLSLFVAAVIIASSKNYAQPVCESIGAECFSGTGQCTRTGTYECRSDYGQPECSAVAADPMPEDCTDQFFDGDCNGLAGCRDPACADSSYLSGFDVCNNTYGPCHVDEQCSGTCVRGTCCPLNSQCQFGCDEDGQCVVPQINGKECFSPLQCVSGHCVGPAFGQVCCPEECDKWCVGLPEEPDTVFCVTTRQAGAFCIENADCVGNSCYNGKCVATRDASRCWYEFDCPEATCSPADPPADRPGFCV